jgi:serine/threonine protein kinase
MLKAQGLGIPLEFPLQAWRKALPLLPILDSESNTLKYHPSTKQPPTVHLTFGAQLYEGTFGKLFYCLRQQEHVQDTAVIVKQPKVSHDLLLSEAFVQYYAYLFFASRGFSAHIPKLFDIFHTPSKKEVWFTMEYKEGPNIVDWLLSVEKPEFQFAYILAQLCILLDVLHDSGIDHRDLKANNIIVNPSPCIVRIGTRIITFPFTLILIDFGFACVGELDVSKGAFPALDPCPKEGRDMFHLLASLWSIQPLRERIQTTWESWILRHLVSSTGKSYAEFAERVKNNEWIYLLSGAEKFRAPRCSPQQILQDLCADEWLQ